MDLWQMMLVALLVALLALFIRQQRPEMAALLTLTTGVVFLIGILGQLRIWLETLEGIAERVEALDGLWQPMVKAILIAYLSEFTAQVCRDASEGALAQKIELAGRVGIAVLTLPILMNILEVITELLT